MSDDNYTNGAQQGSSSTSPSLEQGSKLLTDPRLKKDTNKTSPEEQVVSEEKQNVLNMRWFKLIDQAIQHLAFWYLNRIGQIHYTITYLESRVQQNPQLHQYLISVDQSRLPNPFAIPSADKRQRSVIRRAVENYLNEAIIEYEDLASRRFNYVDPFLFYEMPSSAYLYNCDDDDLYDEYQGSGQRRRFTYIPGLTWGQQVRRANSAPLE